MNFDVDEDGENENSATQQQQATSGLHNGGNDTQMRSSAGYQQMINATKTPQPSQSYKLATAQAMALSPQQ